jgi:hypothetical protein
MTPKNVWEPFTTEPRPHPQVSAGDRVMESWGVVTVAAQTVLPDGRYRYSYEGGTHTQPDVVYHASNWPMVVISGGYSEAN